MMEDYTEDFDALIAEDGMDYPDDEVDPNLEDLMAMEETTISPTKQMHSNRTLAGQDYPSDEDVTGSATANNNNNNSENNNANQVVEALLDSNENRAPEADLADSAGLVRESLQRQRTLANGTSDPYMAFERYTQGSSWRAVGPTDPGQATRWRSPGKRMGNPKRSLPVQSSQLLLLQENTRAYYYTGASGKQRRTIRISSHQVPKVNPGQQSVPMTCGTGERVYWPSSQQSVKVVGSRRASLSTSSNSQCLLGEPIQSILSRVRQKRTPTQSLPLYAVAGDSTSSSSSSQLWVDKYAPRSFVHLLSDERTNRTVLQALKLWDNYVFRNGTRPNESQRVILLTGPAGAGKTTLAHTVARHCGYRPVEINASDDRTATILQEQVLRAMDQTLSLNHQQMAKPNCIILDEIDGADARGAITMLLELIRAEPGTANKPYLQRPLIFIANNKYAPPVRPLLTVAQHFAVPAPHSRRILSRLQTILKAEQPSQPLETHPSVLLLLHQLAQSGDIRSCLFTLQLLATAARTLSRDGDWNSALQHALQQGMGLGKDQRRQVTGIVQQIFSQGNLQEIIQAVEDSGESMKVIDSLFGNLLQIPYIDPTMDRCATIHEWISSSDHIQAKHVPAVAGVAQVLCRVQNLRSNIDFYPQPVLDSVILANFAHDNLYRYRETASWIAPYLTWILSPPISLLRGSLPKADQPMVERLATLLCQMNLQYQKGSEENSTKLEPPIDRITSFSDLHRARPAMSPLVLEHLQRAMIQKRLVHQPTAAKSTKENSNRESIDSQAEQDQILSGKTSFPSKRPLPTIVRLPASKRVAPLGSQRRSHAIKLSDEKKSNTGSGVPLQNVVRLKYVKGFTQAVRTPCRIDDLF